MLKKLFIFSLLLPQLLFADPITFSKAKKILPDVYKGMEETIYCGCDYGYKGKKLIPDLNSCGYQVRKEVWVQLVDATLFYYNK